MIFDTLQLDIIIAYGGAWAAERLEAFRAAISTVIGSVEETIRAEHPRVRLRMRFVTFDQASALEDIGTTCPVAILETSECDERLPLLIGRLQGARVPYFVLCQGGPVDAIRRMGLSAPEVLVYRSIDQLGDVLQQELFRAVPAARIQEELIYQFWFPRETGTIWVVCPQIRDPGEYADRSSPDYTYLDNLGDTDALLDVMVFLSQYYPKATIEHFSSTDLPEGHTSSNLVVIGGPGSPEINNEICGEMMREMNAHVTYSPDCEQMIVAASNGEVTGHFQAEYGNRRKSAEAQTELRRDHGYFARFPNPLNENAAVVLINGIHTAGVVGGARVFSERREALRNFDAVLASDSPHKSFECHFEVLVLNGNVKVPVVDPRNIHPLGRTQTAATARVHAGGQGVHTRESVTVLFIAGDRGGTQVNQLQIPKEYRAIREALHASKHRDVIGLSNPILAATREQLAEAYRERPDIVHFAGHGNNRSLSIIEDRDVIAKEIPLDSKGLCELLQTMEPPVRLCVLNACGSKAVAEEIVQAGAVACAIGWSAKVTDSVAIAFSGALYGALGDGRSIADAVSVAKVASGTGDQPELVVGSGSENIVFVLGEGDKK
jgi:hypothetical protein